MDRISGSILAPVVGALGGVQDMMFPLWSALITIAIISAMLMSWAGVGQVVTNIWSTIALCVLAYGALAYAPQIVDWTVGQAESFAGLAGGSAAVVSPPEIWTAGFTLFGRLQEHAAAIHSLLVPSSWVQSVGLIIASYIIVGAYLLIGAFMLGAFVELYFAVLLLMPLFVFLSVLPMGFGQVALSPISFVMSSTVRIAAYALIASGGFALLSDPMFGIPEGAGEIDAMQGLMAMLLAIFLVFLVWHSGNLISGIILGRGTGFSAPATAMVSALSYAGGSALGAVGGGGGFGRVGDAAARAGGGGGGGGFGSGMGGAVSRRSLPVNSRSS